LKNDNYVQSIIDLIENKIEYFEKLNYNSPEFFDKYKGKINIIEESSENYKNNTKLFTLYKLNEIDNGVNEELFGYLNFLSPKLNNIKTQLDFDKGHFLYFFHSYLLIVKDFNLFLTKLYDHVNYINFTSYQFDDFLSIGIGKGSLTHSNYHFNLQKIEIAYLFKILMNENIVSFDLSSESKNKLKMKKFIEANFTYLKQGTTKRIPIKDFNKEYAEAHSSVTQKNINKELIFLDFFIEIFNRRKQELLNSNTKNSL